MQLVLRSINFFTSAQSKIPFLTLIILVSYPSDFISLILFKTEGWSKEDYIGYKWGKEVGWWFWK